MAKRWTYKDDVFLVRYIDMGADFIASHDLGFADGAGEKRVKILKKTGLFEKIDQAIKAELTAHGSHTLQFSRSDEARYVWSKTLEDIGFAGEST
jgi:hypothetical protein